MAKQFTPPKRPADASPPVRLWRRVLLRLESVIGVGVFVGIGIAAQVAQSAVLWALTLAAVVTLANQWSNASDIAARSPAWLQFMANWALFLAKLTAAATAALGVAGYLLTACHQTDPIWLVPTALLVVVGLTLSLRSRLSPRFIPLKFAGLALISLCLLLLVGIPAVAHSTPELTSLLPMTGPSLLQATALMTTAYASPRQTTERSGATNTLTIVIIWLLYCGVAIVSISAVGIKLLGSSVVTLAAPLGLVMQHLALPGGIYLIAVGAMAAMVSKIILLLPQLTEQLLDLSQSSEQADPVSRAASSASSPFSSSATSIELFLSPQSALLFIGIALGCILMVSDIQIIWSFSAFALLLHYAIYHWMALRLQTHWLHGIGLVVCLLLAFQVEWSVWLVSLGLVSLGAIWRGMMLWVNEQE